MKSIAMAGLAATILLATAGVGQAQEKAERIYGFAQIQRAPEWYAAQLKLWGAEVEKNRSNADAWLNYYRAARYVGFSDTSDWKVKREKMDRLIGDMGKAIPNTFEYHFVRWWDGGNDAERFPDLQKAYELRPDYSLLSDGFVTYSEMNGDEETMRFFCKKWYETKDISPALLSYNYNVLMSLEKNAILFTAGDNDTYPIWILQYALGIRPDVTMMNASLEWAPEYRGRMMKQHGIQCDYAKLNADSLIDGGFDTWASRFFQNIAMSNTKRPVYFGLTVDPSYLDSIRKDLYTVGLASRYSPKRLDNVALLKKNWENFHLDYLDHGFYDESYVIAKGTMPMLNMNYVAPMMILYEHYLLSGESGKAEKFKNLALRIGRDGEQEKEVQAYIDRVTKPDADRQEDIPERQNADADQSESMLERQVTIFPNPAYSTLTLQLPEALESDIQLVDLQGHVLRTLTGSGRECHGRLSGVHKGLGS
ncbi:MAG: hypothetical protein ABI876_07690, partial [Bacteroidota bacterium]